ncbi:MAG: N-acetylmuramoyl-L-alanine [Desulfobulbaceae bacterium]|nr:MAG: N-acetylmuramoyl-L-alanine [Desulfobulbaceae bacterium]
MHRLIIFFLFITLSFLPLNAQSLFADDTPPDTKAADTATVSSEEVPAQKNELRTKFDEATIYFTEIRSDKERAATPANWATAIENFEKIQELQPSSSYAAASLFMLGRISYARYQQFKAPADLDKSIDYYTKLPTLFPWHQLADDALLTLGRIQLEDKKNPQEAAKDYGRIVKEYYTGDLVDKATEKLKLLAKEFNTPVPTVPEALPAPAVTTPAAPAAQPAIEEAPPSETAAAELPNVKNRSYVQPIEHWSSDNYTRIVIKTSRPVSFHEELLEKVGEQPRRLFIDFDKSYIEPKYRAPIPIKDGLLQQVRTAQYTPEKVRVVLDIESIESYKIYSFPDPFRVIVDVHGQQPAAVAAETKQTPEPTAQADPPETTSVASPEPPGTEASTAKKPLLIPQDLHKIKFSSKSKAPAPERGAPIPSPVLSLAQQLNLGVRRIVIDPGHGGKDPGASAFGMKEKDIVLQVAKKLAIKLKQELGCEVLLTRNKDVFLSLEERTAIANTSGADLFISLHLNAHPSEKVYGFETYYLNLSTDPEAIRVAALENATSTHQLSDLQGILSDIMKNSKIDESSRLARQVQEALSSGLAGRNYPQVKSLGVKQAPFYVLIGAEMPAILIEMGFISNKTDAYHVKKEGYQDALSAEIVQGLQKYIRTITAGL